MNSQEVILFGKSQIFSRLSQSMWLQLMLADMDLRTPHQQKKNAREFLIQKVNRTSWGLGSRTSLRISKKGLTLVTVSVIDTPT